MCSSHQMDNPEIDKVLVNYEEKDVTLYANMSQVDGMSDYTFEVNQIDTPVSVRSADFTFNKTKQINANLPDYAVNLNNFNENATIKCSSGFYAAIVKPLFASLNLYSIFSCLNISVKLVEMIATNDKNKHEANSKLTFNFTSQHGDLGGVVVHTYHSS